MKKLLLILLLLSCQLSYSKNIEELKLACKSENTAKSWNALAQYYYDKGNEELLKDAANKAHELAIKEKSDLGIGTSLLLLAQVNYINQWSEYITHISEALKYLEKTDSIRLQVDAISSLGYAYNNISQYDEAIKQYKESIKRIQGQEKIKRYLAPAYINTGFAFLYKGQIDSTLNYITKAQEIASTLRDTTVLIACHDQLGIIHKRQGNQALALEQFNQSLELYKSTQNYKAVCITLANISSVYNDWMRPDEALFFIREAVKYAYRNPEDEFNLGRTLNQLGILLCNKKNYIEGLDTLRLATPMLKENKYVGLSNFLGLSNAHHNLNHIDSADIYMEKVENTLAENKNLSPYLYYGEKGAQLSERGRYYEAISLLEKYIEETQNAQKKYSITLYHRCNQLATALEKGPKDYKKALFYKNMAYNYRDSLYANEQDRIANDFHIKYQTAEKDLQISELNRQQQEMRYNRTVIIGISVIVAILLSLAWIYSRLLIVRRDKEAAELKIRIEEKDNDYQQLISNIELTQMKHYLTGLETERTRLAKELHDHIANNIFILDIELKANKQVPESVHLQIEELYTQIRNISHDLMPPTFQYVSLYQNIAGYLTLLNEQSKTDFELVVENDEIEVPQHIAFEIYRIIQETTGNIIKHAHAEKAQVIFQSKNNYVILIIEDNGRGFDIDKQRKGIGLQIIIDRCKSINAQLRIDTLPSKGCKLEIAIPLSPQDVHE